MVIDPIWFIFSAWVDGITARAERREIGAAEFGFALERSDHGASLCGVDGKANMGEVRIESESAGVQLGGIATAPGKTVVCKVEGTSAGVEI